MKANLHEESYRDGVNVLLEDRLGRVAVQLRDALPDVSYGGLWGLFGGWLEPGESPQQAAIREMLEELSIDLEPSRLVFIGTVLIQVVRARDFVFRYLVTDEFDHAQLNEGQAFQFMSRQELRLAKMVPHHLELLEWVWSRPGVEEAPAG